MNYQKKMRNYSKLRNDDEIAATLFRIHGVDLWAWYHMSKRLKKNTR